jgi:hypothetical protein
LSVPQDSDFLNGHYTRRWDFVAQNYSYLLELDPVLSSGTFFYRCVPESFPNAHLAPRSISNVAFSLLSMTGSLFLVSTYILFPSVRAFPANLVCWMAVCGVLQSVGLALSSFTTVHSTGLLCQVQAFLSAFGMHGVACWLSTLGIIAVFCLYYNQFDHSKLSMYIHYIAWPAISIPPCTLLALGAFGGRSTLPYCWVINDHWISEGPFCVYILASLVCLLLFCVRVHRLPVDCCSRFRVVLRTILFPLAALTCWLASFIEWAASSRVGRPWTNASVSLELVPFIFAILWSLFGAVDLVIKPDQRRGLIAILNLTHTPSGFVLVYARPFDQLSKSVGSVDLNLHDDDVDFDIAPPGPRKPSRSSYHYHHLSNLDSA